jgi:hypothetical protein
MYVAESGATWATGAQSIGKRISEWVLDASGNLVAGYPRTLIAYNGAGKASCVGLAAGPDGLYFSDLYKDSSLTSPIERGANILRVRWIGLADCNGNGVPDDQDIASGSSQDCNGNGIPDGKEGGVPLAAASGGTRLEDEPIFGCGSLAALYATRGQHLARNTLIAAGLGCWAAYRLFLQT